MHCRVVPGLLRVHYSPKCGSTSIREAARSSGCFTDEPVDQEGPEYRWGCVRHPLDRLVSVWTFFCTEDRLRNQVNLRNLGYRASMDFGEFLGVALTNPHADKHTTPQSVYMGPQPFDRLARLENLGDEWAALCERFPEIRSDIEWKNKTGHADWRDYYTPKLRQRAEEVYAAGMALWAMTGESRNGN